MDYRIFNVREDVNARGCTRECTVTLERESARKVDSRRQILCRTGQSKLPQRRAGPTFYHLTTSPSVLGLKTQESRAHNHSSGGIQLAAAKLSDFLFLYSLWL